MGTIKTWSCWTQTGLSFSPLQLHEPWIHCRKHAGPVVGGVLKHHWNKVEHEETMQRWQRHQQETCTANHRVAGNTSDEGSSRWMSGTSYLSHPAAAQDQLKWIRAGLPFLRKLPPLDAKAVSCPSLHSDEPTCPTCAGLISTVSTSKRKSDAWYL